MSNPKKEYGSTRGSRIKSRTESDAYAQYYYAIHQPGIVVGNCRYSAKNGCSVIYQEGHFYHKEEMDVAEALMEDGINVVLQPESKAQGGISLNSKDGNPNFPEGILSGAIWYEQKSIDDKATNLAAAVKMGLKHARDKNASVAVIYDPLSRMDESMVRKGIQDYINQFKGHSKVWNFKQIVVVGKTKKPHYWHIE